MGLPSRSCVVSDVVLQASAEEKPKVKVKVEESGSVMT